MIPKHSSFPTAADLQRRRCLRRLLSEAGACGLLLAGLHATAAAQTSSAGQSQTAAPADSPLALSAANGLNAAGTLYIAAAASLVDVMPALVRSFASKGKGSLVTVRYGASGDLLDQVASGQAATDVLLSADAQTVALGVQRRLLVPDLRSVFATNQLVLITPKALNLPLRRLEDLGQAEIVRIAMGRQSTDPAGRYAREAINAKRLWPSLQRKVVAAQDVREVLDLVAKGDVEAGFVFATDAAAAADRVRVVETLNTTTPIRYLAHRVLGSAKSELAQSFVAHLRSGESRGTLQAAGFGLQ